MAVRTGRGELRSDRRAARERHRGRPPDAPRAAACGLGLHAPPAAPLPGPGEAQNVGAAFGRPIHAARSISCPTHA